MNKFLSTFVFAFVAILSAQAYAGTVFSDTFNSENGGNGTVNYYSFANWTVMQGGSVDLIGNNYYDFLAGTGHGLYIDMDGSTSHAGTMVSKGLALDEGSYLLSFDLAGNHRSEADIESVLVNVLGPSGTIYSEQFSLPALAGFTTYTRIFTVGGPATINLSFAGTGGDNVGMLLDNVNVANAVPLPAGAWSGLVLLGGLGAMRIRRKLMA